MTDTMQVAKPGALCDEVAATAGPVTGGNRPAGVAALCQVTQDTPDGVGGGWQAMGVLAAPVRGGSGPDPP